MTNILVLGNDTTHIDVYFEYILKEKLNYNVFIWGENIKKSFDYANKYKFCNAVETAIELEVLIKEIKNIFISPRFVDDHFSYLLYSLTNAELIQNIFVDKILVNNINQFNFIEDLSKLSNSNIISASPYRFNESVNKFKFKDFKNHSIRLVSARCCNDLGSDYRFKDLGFYFIHISELLYSISKDIELLESKPVGGELQLKVSIDSTKIEIILDDFQPTEDIIIKILKDNKEIKKINFSNILDIEKMYNNYFDFVTKFFLDKINSDELLLTLKSHKKAIQFMNEVRKSQ